MPVTREDARGGGQAEGTYDYDAPYALGEQEAEVLWATEDHTEKSHMLRFGLRGQLTDGFTVYGGGVADAVGRKVDYYFAKRGARVGEVLDAFEHLAGADGLYLPDCTGNRCRVVVEEDADDRRGGFRPRIAKVLPLGATQPAPAPAARPATAGYRGTATAPPSAASELDEAADAYDFGL